MVIIIISNLIIITKTTIMTVFMFGAYSIYQVPLSLLFHIFIYITEIRKLGLREIKQLMKTTEKINLKTVVLKWTIVPQLLQMCRMLPKRPISLSPHPE